MKKLYMLLLMVALLMLSTACVKVEDENETETEENTASIVSDDISFSVSWSKNSDGYGQLEITDDYTTAKGVIAVVVGGEKEVKLNCEYRKDIADEKEYKCNIENADKIGSFDLRLPYEKELLVVERSGNKDSSHINVLTQFLIYEAHGTEE